MSTMAVCPMVRRLWLGALLFLFVARPAAADPLGQQRLAAALAEQRLGRPQEAAAALAALAESIAERDPTAAAESLFRAAQLQDEQLSDPQEAQRLYTRTAERFPTSRFAERARRRSSELRAFLGSDRAVLAEFNQVVAAYMTLGRPAVIARLTRLLTEYPRFPQADRALFLLGTAYGDASPRAAERTLCRLLSTYPQSPWVPHAQRALAELALHSGDHALARQRFAALQLYPQPLWQQAAQQGFAACARVLLRHRLATVCWCYLLVLGAVLGWSARRRLLPPPIEVLYYVPVGALLVLVTILGRGAHAASAMAGLALGGSVLSWLSGAAGRTPGGGGLLAGTTTRVLAAAAICYLAVYHGGLLDLVLQTWHMGPEPG